MSWLPTPIEIAVAAAVAILATAVVVGQYESNTPNHDIVPCPPRGITVDGDVAKVVDGDTIDVRVEFAFRVRLIDCWAPESRTKDLKEKFRGLAAKGYMLELADRRRVRVHIPGSDNLAELLSLDRVMGRAWILHGANPAQTDLSNQMIAAGHATEEKPPKTEPTE